MPNAKYRNYLLSATAELLRVHKLALIECIVTAATGTATIEAATARQKLTHGRETYEKPAISNKHLRQHRGNAAELVHTSLTSVAVSAPFCAVLVSQIASEKRPKHRWHSP